MWRFIRTWLKLDQSAKEFIDTKTDKNDVDYYRYLKDLEIYAN